MAAHVRIGNARWYGDCDHSRCRQTGDEPARVRKERGVLRIESGHVIGSDLKVPGVLPYGSPQPGGPLTCIRR